MFKNENIIIEYNIIYWTYRTYRPLRGRGRWPEERESACRRRRSTQRGGGPRSGLPDLQSALAFWPQTLLHSALALALPWAHHRSTPASGEALLYGGDWWPLLSARTRQGSHSQLLLLLDGGAWLPKYKLCFSYQLHTLDKMLKKTRKKIRKLCHMTENVVEFIALRKNQP